MDVTLADYMMLLLWDMKTARQRGYIVENDMIIMCELLEAIVNGEINLVIKKPTFKKKKFLVKRGIH